MAKKDINYPKNLIKSIMLGLKKLEKGSRVEGQYLDEKTDKLRDWVLNNS